MRAKEEKKKRGAGVTNFAGALSEQLDLFALIAGEKNK